MRFFFSACLVLLSTFGIGQHVSSVPNGLTFIENKNQWPDQVHFQTDIPGARVWMEDGQITYAVYRVEDIEDAHEAFHHDFQEQYWVSAHAFQVRFENALYAVVEGHQKLPFYYNFFLGNDRSKWAGNVGAYKATSYQQLYEGINLRFYGVAGSLKYDFEVLPNANANQISLNYFGARGLSIEDGNLIVKTSVGNIQEGKPYAYQIIEGKEVEVECKFAVEGNNVAFQFPGGYDETKVLIIDPIIVASTNSGSTVSGFGHTATYDNLGNVYAAGRSFGIGHPTDTGSFQMNFAGGGSDVGISKYNPDGSSLIYATYLGGSAADSPHSMIVNNNNQLCVLGTTGSNDFPVSTNAFDTSHNGGNDMTVTIFSDSGDAIVGSTYLGGAGSDGVNSISMNYGDNFRGEIELDRYGNVFVANVTSSNDFPTTQGAIQDSASGSQDGVLVKFNQDLSILEWSTMLGGAGDDAIFGVKIDKKDRIFISGSTSGNGFVTTSGVAYPNYLGGDKDGFVARISPDGQTLMAASYFGTSSKDQNFFIQLDKHGFVYLFGQSDSSIQSTTGRYQAPFVGSYVYKTNMALDTIIWVSAFGASNSNYAPTAFLVDNCDNIYVAGHGALSSILGFDTLDAVNNLSSAGFYTMSLTPDATALQFGSYYGNSGSHVDGGTSRFDKRGIIYEATCSNGLFPLTNWAYSGSQNGGAYDITVFKIDFEVNGTAAFAGVSPDVTGCAPFTVDFNNFGSDGNTHFWDFGDGFTDTAQAPTHTFDSSGSYTVTYVISDTAACNQSDTAELVINVLDPPTVDLGLDTSYCVDSLQLNAFSPFADYLWSTGEISASIFADTSGPYWVEVDNGCGVASDSIDVDIQQPFSVDLGNDTSVCFLGFLLNAGNPGSNYLWSTLDTTQTISVDTTGLYYVEVSNGFCSEFDSILIDVVHAEFFGDTIVCEDSILLDAGNPGKTYLWSTSETTQTITVDTAGIYWVAITNGLCTTSDTVEVSFNPQLVDLGPDTTHCDPQPLSAFDTNIVSYQWSTGDSASSIITGQPGLYWVEVSNGICASRDSVNISMINVSLENAYSACDTAQIAITVPEPVPAQYRWSTGDTTRMTIVDQPGLYTVTTTNQFCTHIDTVSVLFGNSPVFDLGDDFDICLGELVSLEPNVIHNNYFWSTGDTTRSIIASVFGTYSLTIAENGCFYTDSITLTPIELESDEFAFMPNIFTPNADGYNDDLRFNIYNTSVVTGFELRIFNRWGGLMFQSNDVGVTWDGNDSSGKPAQDGVYFWQLEYTTTCTAEQKQVENGTVHLMR